MKRAQQKAAFQPFIALRNHALPLATLGLAALTAAGCAQQKNPMDVSFTSSLATSSKVEMDYIRTYAAVARGLNQCWLADNKPLQHARLFARTKNKGENRKSDIFLHEPAESPKRGPRIVSVHLSPAGKGTDLRIANQKLDSREEALFENDVRRWASGGEGCNPSANKVEQVTFTPERANKLEASRVTLPVRKAAKK